MHANPVGLLLQIQNRWGFRFHHLGAPPWCHNHQSPAIQGNASHSGFIDQFRLHPFHQLPIILTEPCSDAPVRFPQLPQRRGAFIASIDRYSGHPSNLVRAWEKDCVQRWWSMIPRNIFYHASIPIFGHQIFIEFQSQFFSNENCLVSDGLLWQFQTFETIDQFQIP